MIKNPVLVDRMVSRLERAGLYRADKGQALRLWVRIQPDTGPFIQTVISPNKLNYMDGKTTEAKACLGQSPYPLQMLFAKATADPCSEDTAKCVFIKNGWYQKTSDTLREWKNLSEINA